MCVHTCAVPSNLVLIEESALIFLTYALSLNLKLCLTVLLVSTYMFLYLLGVSLVIAFIKLYFNCTNICLSSPLDSNYHALFTGVPLMAISTMPCSHLVLHNYLLRKLMNKYFIKRKHYGVGIGIGYPTVESTTSYLNSVSYHAWSHVRNMNILNIFNNIFPEPTPFLFFWTLRPEICVQIPAL